MARRGRRLRDTRREVHKLKTGGEFAPFSGSTVEDTLAELRSDPDADVERLAELEYELYLSERNTSA